MNTPSETIGLAELRKQCEELIEPFRRAKQREERYAKKLFGISRWEKWCRQNIYRICAVIFLFNSVFPLLQSWKEGLTMMVANQKVLLYEGTRDLALGVLWVTLALFWWGFPAVVNRHRLLLLLAEDFLDRNKEPSPAPKPTSAAGA